MALVVTGLIASLTPRITAHPRTTAVTYLQDVSPILERRCVRCHTADGPGRLPLQTYEQARTWSRQIKEEVLERRMPPWPAVTGFADYANDQTLTPIEMELLTAWADGSAPLGTAATTGVATMPPASPPRSLEIAIPASGAPRGRSERIEVPHALRSGMWMAGWAFRAQHAAVVQQIELFAGTVPIGSWVPGDPPAMYPPGVAQHLAAGASVLAEVHYTKAPEGGMGGGVLTVYPGTPGAPPKRRTLACAPTTIDRDIQAIAITPAAPAGESIEVVARRPDMTVEPLSVVLLSQPSYPVTYRFRRAVPLPRGTIIDVRSSSSAGDCAATLQFTARRPGRAGAR